MRFLKLPGWESRKLLAHVLPRQVAFQQYTSAPEAEDFSVERITAEQYRNRAISVLLGNAGRWPSPCNLDLKFRL
jgi:hypothetical protein